MSQRLPAARVAAVVLVALLGLAAASYGLLRLSWANEGPSTLEAGQRCALLLGGAFLLVGLGSAWSRQRPWTWGVGLALAAALATANGTALTAAALVLLASAVVGRRVLALLGAGPAAGAWIACALAGAGIYGSLIALAAAYRVHFVPVYLAALVVPLVAARARLKILATDWLRQEAQRQPVSGAVLWTEAAIVAIALLHFVVALLPEVGHDALAMHVFVGNQLVTRHVWSFDVQKYVWAVMPMLADWLFAAAQMLGRESAARLLNLAFLGIVAGLVRELVRWCGGTAWAQRWAILLLLSMPLTFTLSSSLFIELVWASFVLAGLLAVLRFAGPQPDPRAALAAGLFLGFALAAKAVTLTLLPILLVVLLVRWRSWWSREAGWKLVQGSALLLLGGCLPYANAWWRTGNPVFPFFNAVFRSPLYPVENFESATTFGRGLRWDFPYQVAFDSARFLESTPGAGGFHWLLVLAPAGLALLLGWRRRALALLAVALASIAIAFASVAYLRYVFPAFAIACAVAGVAVADPGWSRLQRWALGLGATTAVVLNLVFLPSASPYRDYPFWALMDAAHRDTWLDQQLPMRRAITAVNGLNTGSAPVAVLGQPVIGHLAADALIPNWYNFGFFHLMAAQRSGPELARALQDRGVEYILVDPTWSQGPKPRELLESTTEPIASFGLVTLRRWKPEYRFQQELLANPRFAAGSGWQFTGDAPGSGGSGGALVTVRAPAVQSVAVQPERRYLNTITVACKQPALARAQVNWASARGKFLKADIRVFDCGPEPASHRMEVVSPPEAATATVYSASHTDTPVEFRENSFRR